MHRLTALCVRHPWLTLLVAVAAAVTAGRSTLRTELSVGMDSTLGVDHPVLRAPSRSIWSRPRARL